MSTLVQQRCFNHAAREAAARCPACKQFFCRECVTEHEDRVLCAACLRKLVQARAATGRTLARVIRFAQWAVGILIAWFFFFLIGETLVRLPDAFHEGTIWQVPRAPGE
jgi:hypothetical protein